MLHELKIYPKYFQETIEGNKPFEIRKNDRHFQVGDVLLNFIFPSSLSHSHSSNLSGSIASILSNTKSIIG